MSTDVTYLSTLSSPSRYQAALLVHYLGSVNPYQFSLTTMLYTLVWVIVGGRGTFWGPIIGVLTLRLVGEQLRGIMETWMPMVYGFIVIGIVLALPDGLESIPKRIRGWRRARQEKG